MKKKEMLEHILESLEISRNRYREVIRKPERYREPYELDRAEAHLLTIECLCMRLGVISEMTI